MLHFQASDSSRETRWDHFLANTGSISSRSLSLPRSRASAGSFRSPLKRTHDEAFEKYGLFPCSGVSAGSSRSRSLSPPYSMASAGSNRSPLERTREEAFEQHGGGILTKQPLLEFQLTPTGQRRAWRVVVNRVTFRARLDQQREPTPRDNLGVELTETLRRAIQRQIDKQTSTTPNTRVHFVMQYDALTHAFQSFHFLRTRVCTRQ